MTKHFKNNWMIISYTLVWFSVNLLTLITYPLMHSDEAWLAGLTRTMMDQHNLMATEPFFNLAPRAPHTLKTLFHLIQMPFIELIGYNLFSVRVVSLVFGTMTLIVLYLYLNRQITKKVSVLIPLMLITLNSQFLYGSHFARQEIQLVFILVLCLYLYVGQERVSLRSTLVISSLIGLSISFHPNAFIIAFMIGILYLSDFLFRDRSLKTLLAYVGPMAFFALINLVITFSYTPNFINKYWQYASTLTISAAPISRLQNFLDFYYKLYHQISGTYFLTNLKYLVPLSALVVLATCLSLVIIKRTSKQDPRTVLLAMSSKKARPLWQCLEMVLGYNCALFIIGRNNPTSIIFLLIVVLLFICHIIDLIPNKSIQIGVLLLGLLLTLNATYKDIESYQHHDYVAYNQFIDAHIGPSDLVLGNLSGGFAMDPSQFYDIRNLNYLGRQSLKDYILTNKITTIVYYEEYDYIHRNPQWSILYGDDSPYYEPLVDLLDQHGRLRAETSSPYYGNRIIRYLGDYSWTIKIYDIDVTAID